MPTRTCIGCRRTDEQDVLIRLVRRGERVVDGTRPRSAGRGAYVHRTCVDLAIERRAITRAFGAVTLDEAFLASLEPEGVTE